jgi:hypothetical protein
MDEKGAGNGRERGGKWMREAEEMGIRAWRLGAGKFLV